VKLTGAAAVAGYAAPVDWLEAAQMHTHRPERLRRARSGRHGRLASRTVGHALADRRRAQRVHRSPQVAVPSGR
jgi:hypothetical protein